MSDVSSSVIDTAAPAGGDAESAVDQKLYGPDLIRAQGLWKTIVEDYRAAPRDPFAPGFIAMVVYRYGTWTRTFRSKTVRRLARVPYWFGYLSCRNLLGIQIFDTAMVGRRLVIGHQHGISIPLNATIGDDCVIRQGVTLGIAGGFARDKGPVLGDRVDIGVGAVIMGAVTLGDDVRVGPNVVIQTNIPAGSTVVAGAPRVISGVKRQGKLI